MIQETLSGTAVQTHTGTGGISTILSGWDIPTFIGIALLVGGAMWLDRRLNRKSEISQELDNLEDQE